MKRLMRMVRPGAAAGLLMALACPLALAQEAVPAKVAVINVVQLLEESDPGKKGIDELKALQIQKTNEQEALKAAGDELRKQISQGQFSLSEERLADLQKDLEDKLIELQRFKDDANRELQVKQEDLLKNIQGLVMPIIETVGREGCYTMIFNKFESGLVYANEAIDITSLVMERLNSSAAAVGPAVEPSPGS